MLASRRVRAIIVSGVRYNRAVRFKLFTSQRLDKVAYLTINNYNL